MSKNKNSKGKRSIKSSLMNYLRDAPSAGFNPRQIAAALEVSSKQDKAALQQAIEELVKAGKLAEEGRGKFKAVNQSYSIEGKVDITRSGGAYVITDQLEEDVYIAPRNTANALPGDRVKVSLFAHRQGKKQTGEIVEILERGKTSYVGVIDISDRFSFVVPDDSKMPVDIFIPPGKEGNATDKYKVLVEITGWPQKYKNPIGIVVEVLGPPGEHSTEIHSIIAEFGLPGAFSEEVEQEADALSDEVTAKDINERKDFRTTTTFTIDPEDAKDFDDAISFKKLDNGNYEIGVHIADVTHYVKPGTKLDDEALDRATSVYLVDRVIPMLPERLSNGLCSLRPKEDKFTYSAVFELDSDAVVKSEWFGKTLIHSDHRFSYEGAQKVLEQGEGIYAEELLILNDVAHKLRKEKVKAGAISFETEEVKFVLDKEGFPVDIKKKERKDAHKLIEEYMLLANRKVAEFVGTAGETVDDNPYIYRVHDTPAEDKLLAFAKVANTFGYKFPVHALDQAPAAFNKILRDIQGRPEQALLQSLALRSMPKAFYTSKKSGHFGLAFQYYTHFTSPIRRYPDVVAHRLLTQHLDKKKPLDQENIEAIAKHSSERELRATDAERASIKYKQVQYMKERIGEVFEGIITGVTEWGIYVETTEAKCEGMIRVSEMNDDFYELDEVNYILRGRNTGKTYRLGDKLQIEVKVANLAKRTLDYGLVEEG